VLLTHTTPAPKDFETAAGDPTYHVKCRKTCTWPQIYRALTSSNGSSEKDQSDAWRTLATELADFIKEQDMQNETVNFFDLAGSEIFLRSAQRFDRTFSEFGEQVGKFLPKLIAQKRPRLDDFRYDTEGGVIRSEAFFLRPKGLDKVYIQWGICFPTANGNWWNDPSQGLPQAPFAFVFIFDNSSASNSRFSQLAKQLGNKPEWKMVEEENQGVSYRYPVASKTIHSLQATNGEIGLALAEWMAARAAELSKTVKS
jgi:hypothetical protein